MTQTTRQREDQPGRHDEVMPGRRSSLDDIIDVYKKDVDRTLPKEQLRKTPDERLRELVELERFAEKLRKGVKRTAR